LTRQAAGDFMLAQGWTCPHRQRAGGWPTAIVAGGLTYKQRGGWPVASTARCIIITIIGA